MILEKYKKIFEFDFNRVEIYQNVEKLSSSNILTNDVLNIINDNTKEYYQICFGSYYGSIRPYIINFGINSLQYDIFKNQKDYKNLTYNLDYFNEYYEKNFSYSTDLHRLYNNSFLRIFFDKIFSKINIESFKKFRKRNSYLYKFYLYISDKSLERSKLHIAEIYEKSMDNLKYISDNYETLLNKNKYLQDLKDMEIERKYLKLANPYTEYYKQLRVFLKPIDKKQEESFQRVNMPCDVRDVDTMVKLICNLSETASYINGEYKDYSGIYEIMHNI